MTRAHAKLRRLLVLAATALSFLLGQFEAADHLASTMHVACSEHGGQIEDVAGGPELAPAGHSHADHSISEAPRAESGHHLCTLANPCAGSALAPELARRGMDAAAYAHSSSLVETAAFAAMDTLSYAPKQSPPRV